MKRPWPGVLAAMMLGCAPPPPSTAPSTTTSPVGPVAVAETPVVRPSPPVLRGQSFRVRTDFLGKPEVAFALETNGVSVGNFNSDGLTDITNLIVPGDNTVKVRWNLDKRMNRDDLARIVIESRRDDQDDWNVVFSREVNSLTRQQEAEGEFTVVTTPASS